MVWVEVEFMRVVEDPKCKDCRYRMLVNVYMEFSSATSVEPKQYYVCMLSYCPFEGRDKFVKCLDSIKL
jgi:transposase-like protein